MASFNSYAVNYQGGALRDSMIKNRSNPRCGLDSPRSKGCHHLNALDRDGYSPLHLALLSPPTEDQRFGWIGTVGQGNGEWWKLSHFDTFYVFFCGFDVPKSCSWTLWNTCLFVLVLLLYFFRVGTLLSPKGSPKETLKSLEKL